MNRNRSSESIARTYCAVNTKEEYLFPPKSHGVDYDFGGNAGTIDMEGKRLPMKENQEGTERVDGLSGR